MEDWPELATYVRLWDCEINCKCIWRNLSQDAMWSRIQAYRNLFERYLLKYSACFQSPTGWWHMLPCLTASKTHKANPINDQLATTACNSDRFASDEDRIGSSTNFEPDPIQLVCRSDPAIRSKNWVGSRIDPIRTILGKYSLFNVPSLICSEFGLICVACG